MTERDDINRSMDMVEEMRDRDRDAIRKAQAGRPPGGVELTDEQFRAFYEQRMIETMAIIMTEDGRAIVGSTWVAHLAFVEGGNAVQDRYARIVGKDEG